MIFQYQPIIYIKRRLPFHVFTRLESPPPPPTHTCPKKKTGEGDSVFVA